MICRMCLLDSTEALNIFDTDSHQFNIAATIAEHFWFEPKADDPISNIVCNSCWWKIESFHVYYRSVEESHRKLSERFSVKQEPHHSHHSNTGNELYLKVEDTKSAQVKEVENRFVDGGGAEEIIVSGEDGDIATLIEIVDEKIEDEGECSYDVHCEDDINDAAAESSEHMSEEELMDEIEMNQELQSEGVITRRAKYLEAQKNLEEFIKLEVHEEKLNEPDSNLLVETRTKRTRRKTNTDEISIKTMKPTTEYLRKSKEDDAKIAQHMKLKCEFCNADYPTFAEVKKHYRTVHRQKGYVVCCNKKLYKRVLILDHINKHLNPEYFKCVECHKIFADKQCLKNHMVRHESDDAKNFRCEHCPRRFAKQYLLDQHKLIHTPQEERQHFCEECGKAFPTNNLLQTHRRYVHENAYGQMCHICAKVIRGKALFAKHQLEHAGVTEPKVQCQKCGAWLKHEYSLKKHMARHNESRNEHVCTICGKTAPSKGALRSHTRYVHSSERNFQCSVCDKAFKKAIVLREHMTTHTGEVLYTCPHCPKTFNSSANMHSHRKKVHRKEWDEGRKNRGFALGKLSNTNEEESAIICENSVENLNDSLCVSIIQCDTNI